MSKSLNEMTDREFCIECADVVQHLCIRIMAAARTSARLCRTGNNMEDAATGLLGLYCGLNRGHGVLSFVLGGVCGVPCLEMGKK